MRIILLIQLFLVCCTENLFGQPSINIPDSMKISFINKLKSCENEIKTNVLPICNTKGVCSCCIDTVNCINENAERVGLQIVPRETEDGWKIYMSLLLNGKRVLQMFYGTSGDVYIFVYHSKSNTTIVSRHTFESASNFIYNVEQTKLFIKENIPNPDRAYFVSHNNKIKGLYALYKGYHILEKWPTQKALIRKYEIE